MIEYKIMNRICIFIGILFLSIILRFWQLENIPQGFHADEAAFGYNAYSILKTGKDEYGNAFPFVLRSFNDYKGAVYSYVTIPFIYVFGLNEWSVRVPSALTGIGIVVLTFFIVKKLTKRKSIAYLSAAFIAISPIFILLSRVQSDPLLAMFFVLFGLYFFLCWVESQRRRTLLVTAFFWAISICTNYLPWLFLFIFIFCLFWYFRKELSKVQKIQGVFLYLFLLGFAFYLLFSFMATRYGQVSVFQKMDVAAVLEEAIREDSGQGLSLSFARVFHNKPIDYGRYLISNYMRYVNFEFLFYQASQPLREKIPNSGVFFMIDMPFFLYGIYIILKKRYRWGKLFLLWFFLVPAVSVFATDETPNIHRFVLAGLPASVIVSLGIVDLYHSLKKKIMQYGFVVIVCGVYLISLCVFLHQLFYHQPVHYPFYRDYPYKELVYKVQEKYSSYKTIVVTNDKGNAYIHFLFHLTYDPATYISSGSKGNEQFGGFDRFIFVPIKCPTKETLEATGKVPIYQSMLVVKSGNCPFELKERMIDTVLWRDGSEAFQLVEFEE